MARQSRSKAKQEAAKAAAEAAELEQRMANAERENMMRASGSPDLFRMLAKEYGFHPDTEAECIAYEQGFALFMAHSGMPDTAPVLPPRPRWRDPVL